jgi:hypothetical protein
MSVVWRDNGFSIVNVEHSVILIAEDKSLEIATKLTPYEIFQAELLKALTEGIERRAKYIPEPESEIEFKKRMGWY